MLQVFLFSQRRLATCSVNFRFIVSRVLIFVSFSRYPIKGREKRKTKRTQNTEFYLNVQLVPISKIQFFKRIS